MHQAADVQFERAVDEFVRWRAVVEDDRSPAPAWWWGPAYRGLGVRQLMPVGVVRVWNYLSAPVTPMGPGFFSDPSSTRRR